MSGLSPNSLTLYLRPLAAIPPYQVNNCARWLLMNGMFRNYRDARMWLNGLEQNQPWRFKSIMSSYYDSTDYKQDYIDKRDVNKYRSTNTKSYGEDPHMWF